MLSKPLKGAINCVVAVDALCSGEFGMPSESAVNDASGAPGVQSVERALALLAEALEIVDALNMSPEIGARLQEAVSALEESSAENRA